MSSKMMRAVGVIPSQKEVRLIDHAAPQISADQQVKVRSLEVGICGTDREICTFVYGSPPEGDNYLVLGHESLGEVVEVGNDVSGLKRGDLVRAFRPPPLPAPRMPSLPSRSSGFLRHGRLHRTRHQDDPRVHDRYYVEDAKYLNPGPRTSAMWRCWSNR